MDDIGFVPRAIRSFALRQGRMTAAQRSALTTLWERYGLEGGAALFDLDILFGRRAPRILEIGFGMGDSLATMAHARPDTDFLGIDVHRPGVGNLLRLIADWQIDNVRVACTDAMGVLERQIPEAALDAVYLFFPDPWPKRRHHKRRIVQPPFVSLIARKLKPGGQFHLATDWYDYAEQMLQVLSSTTHFSNEAEDGKYVPRPGFRPLTKFEQRGRNLGHEVWDLVFTRTSVS